MIVDAINKKCARPQYTSMQKRGNDLMLYEWNEWETVIHYEVFNKKPGRKADEVDALRGEHTMSGNC